jgi:hypothetical protein
VLRWTRSYDKKSFRRNTRCKRVLRLSIGLVAFRVCDWGRYEWRGDNRGSRYIIAGRFTDVEEDITPEKNTIGFLIKDQRVSEQVSSGKPLNLFTVGSSV